MNFLGEDIDLFDIDSIRQAEHVRLQELKALGEQWENLRIDVRSPGVYEWGTDPRRVQLVQIASHASNAIRPRPSYYE